MKKCSEDGCENPHSAKGLCKPHYEKQAYRAQRERRLARAKARYADKREEILASRRLVADAEYDVMLVWQGGVCALCFRPPAGRKTRLCIDHCHATGRIRGLLCDACNRGIGLLGDDVARLRRAIEYLGVDVARDESLEVLRANG